MSASPTTTTTAFKFKPGRLVATAAVDERISEDAITHFLTRHLRGDWGDLDKGDAAMNDAALRSGEDRIFSAYSLKGRNDCNGEDKLWIITEWDRSLTTVLLPSEY